MIERLAFACAVGVWLGYIFGVAMTEYHRGLTTPCVCPDGGAK